MVSVGSDETLVLNDRPRSFSMAQPIEPKSRDVSTQASLLIADPKETNRLEQSADKVIRVGKKTSSCKYSSGDLKQARISLIDVRENSS